MALRDLSEILAEQEQANLLFQVGGRLVWVVTCSGCGLPKATDHQGAMAAGHQLRELGWTATPERVLCLGCSEMF